MDRRQEMAWTITWAIELDIVVALIDRHLWSRKMFERRSALAVVRQDSPRAVGLPLGVVPKANEPPMVSESCAVRVRLPSPTGQLRARSKRHN